MPPRTRRWTLTRPRLYERLATAGDYRLTLLEAPTGYGKTTTLAGWLADSGHAYAWHSLGTVETDPLVLLLHIIYAFRSRFPTAGHAALELLAQEREGGAFAAPTPLLAALHLLINDLCDLLSEETYLVLDDFHLMAGRAESLALVEELVAAAPPRLHLIIASRSRPLFGGLARWQAQGEVLHIGKDDLAFRPAETEQLFQEHYGLELTAEQAALLTDETEGWVIALQMYWQSSGPSLGELPRNLPGLFDYLAQEVLNRQTPPVQDFLLGSSVLRRLRGPECASVLSRPVAECETLLHTLSDSGLFLIPSAPDTPATGPSYRFHHLFGEFLYSRLQQQGPALVQQLHCRAARFYVEGQRPEDAMFHYLASHDYEAARALLENGLAGQLLAVGRLERLEEWLAAFPTNFLEGQASLLVFRGDCYRLTSRFEAALASYHRAAQLPGERPNRAQALRGAALVYLDTVQPAQAEELLEEALALVNSGENRALQAALLRDLAENKINRGRPLEAEGLFRQARALLNQPENPYEDVRIFLRTGRLAEASEVLEQASVAERAGKTLARAGRNHRESLLLLSLINSVRGEGTLAVSRAEEGIRLAQELRAPFTEAVAWQRLGHAHTVANQPGEAHEAYRRGAIMGDKLQVRRLRAEGFMGLCVLEGRAEGNLVLARHAAQEGLQIARRAGDEWIEGFITLGLAGALIQHGGAYYEESRAVLQTARQLLEGCGDRFGSGLASLWLTLLDPKPAALENLRLQFQQAGYAFLLDRPTFFGPKDPATLTLLRENSHPSLLPSPSSLTTPHLTVLALGGFVVRRSDGSELANRDWQREKARQLFQLLLTLRDKPLPKEQILELLWPESDQTAADAGFKVALNALSRALEPHRPSRAQSSYVLKVGSGSGLSYALNLEGSATRFDAAEFEQLIKAGRQAEVNPATNNGSLAKDLPEAALQHYNGAIELYRGDYLPACLYDDWAAPERERLLALFLTTAERLAQAMVARADWERCLSLCRLILARDNCWEEAYRLSMLAYHKLGNRPAALRTYERCTTTLASELSLEPMPQTSLLYQQILNG